MSMIYGRIVAESSAVFSSQLNKLEEFMKWPGCIHHKVECGNFSGGFFYDPRLPYKPDDFYYLDQQKELMVLMSGVIYNRIEIMDRLALKSSIITDPCLISASFTAWGEDFVKELNGDFAIYIYKKSENNSFLYRDHLGIRPIAYTKVNNLTWFSSDAIVLSKVLFANEGVGNQFFINWLIRFGLQSTPLLEEHLQLPNKKALMVFPGHYIHLSSLGHFDNKYWSPEDIREDHQLDFQSMTREIKSLLEDAVKVRCDNRFIASAHLSGGLDSGIVASLARKEYTKQEDFQGFCWTPAGNEIGTVEYDERNLVKKLGEQSGINPVFTNIEANDYISFLSDWRNGSDLFPEIKVFENAVANKINLIFSGLGGDEFVSLSDIGIDSDLLFRFDWITFFNRNPLKRPKRFIRVLLFNVILPASSLRFYSFRKPSSYLSKYLTGKSKIKVKTINHLYHWRSRREMHLRYLYQYHLTDRVEYSNIYGYRNGIEYRYPLIDRRIIEYMLKLPSKLLVKNDYARVILREISEGLLPEEIRWNFSKNDPVRVKALDELFDNVCIQLMDDVDEFAANPELSFINFDLLIKDIDAYRKGFNTKRPSESFEILVFLKKAHEFSKVYSK